MPCVGHTLRNRPGSASDPCNTGACASGYGIYSHRIGNIWLVGGASNTGGAVIRALIGDERLSSLTARFAPDQPRPPPVVETMQALSDQRSMENAVFFQALLVGITRTEQLAYGRPVELGAPQLALVRSVGEGARSANWTSRREKALGVRFCQPAWPKRRPTRPCWSSTP